MSVQNSKKNFFSEWLEKLQQESWQLELLISGLALFGIWSAKGLLYQVDNYLDVHMSTDFDEAINLFVTMLWASWRIFLINLVLHIVIRGFWIGAIGLRYVSGDIDYNELKYSERFTRYFKRRHGSFDDYIERLEKLSSVLFSFTFLLFFILLSLVMYIIVFTICMSLILRIFPLTENRQLSIPASIFFFTYLGMGLIVFIDFITLGSLKKIRDKRLSGVFYFIYRFYETFSLSFIYRPLLLNFIDNKYTKRLFYLAIPYALILVVLKGFSFEKFQYFPNLSASRYAYQNQVSEVAIPWNHYDDLRFEHLQAFTLSNENSRKSKIYYISLEHFENENDYLKFFLEYRDNDNNVLKNKMKDVPAFRKSGMRHSMIRNSIQDETIQELSKSEIAELRAVRKIIQGRKLKTRDSIYLSKYQNNKPEELDELRDEISERYKTERQQYMRSKLAKIKDEFLGLYDLSINDQSIMENLNCKFYVHENLHERGLLCYTPIDSLSYGEHSLRMEKVNGRFIKEIELPFRKVKSNN